MKTLKVLSNGSRWCNPSSKDVPRQGSAFVLLSKLESTLAKLRPEKSMRTARCPALPVLQRSILSKYLLHSATPSSLHNLGCLVLFKIPGATCIMIFKHARELSKHK